MTDSIRDTITEAITTATAPEPVATLEHETPAAEPVAAPVPETSVETGTKLAERIAARDEAGRFATKPKDATAPVKPTAKAVAAPPTTTAPVDSVASAAETAPVKTEALKAPASWKPTARDEWTKVPPSVQAEVQRREKEISSALAEAAPAKRFIGEFGAAIGPHMPMIQRLGGNPVAVVSSLLQTAAAFQDPVRAVGVVAELIKSNNIDIAALDAALAGQASTPAKPPEYRDPRVDQLFSSIEQAKRQRAQATTEKAHADVEAFATKAEFLDDVRDGVAMRMADAAQRGVAVTLEQAYDAECWANPEIRVIVQQRESAKKATTSLEATAQNRAAASSVKSSPSGGTAAPDSTDIRSLITAQMSRR